MDVDSNLVAGRRGLDGGARRLVALTVSLKPVASRWLNVGMGDAFMALILFTMIDAWKFGYYFYIYLGVVEVLLTLLFVSYALRRPRQPAEG